MTATKEEILTFAEKLPYEQLFDKIREVTGIGDLVFEHEIKENYRGEPRIVFSSQDIADHIGVLNLMIKTINIQQFNSGFGEKDGVIYWWGSASFAYTHYPCGSNGHDFMDFWYDKVNGWTFRISKERG